MYDLRLYDKVMARCEYKDGPLDTPCIVWTLHVTHNGYGRIGVNGKLKRTHRVAYESVHGPIPVGLNCLHKCHVRACCNVEHLYIGTQQQNMQDAMRRGTHVCLVKPIKCDNRGTGVRGEKYKTLPIPRYVYEIRRLYYGTNITQARLGAMYGLHQAQISLIVNGKSWKVTAPPKTGGA